MPIFCLTLYSKHTPNVEIFFGSKLWVYEWLFFWRLTALAYLFNKTYIYFLNSHVPYIRSVKKSDKYMFPSSQFYWESVSPGIPAPHFHCRGQPRLVTRNNAATSGTTSTRGLTPPWNRFVNCNKPKSRLWLVSVCQDLSLIGL